MKILRGILALALLVGFAAASFAGDGHEKCDKSAQDCLDAMSAKLATKGWLGIDTEKNDHGAYVVTAVTADSPAERAGFRSGDVLLAVDGVDLYSEDKAELKKVKSGFAPGAELAYTVKRSGGKQKLTATLDKVPETVLAQWIGEHMIDHHAYAQVAAN